MEQLPKPPERNGTIRIGWAGSYTHKDKLLESKEVVHRLYDKYKGKIKVKADGKVNEFSYTFSA